MQRTGTIVATTLLALLAACGGGGSGDAGPEVPEQRPAGQALLGSVGGQVRGVDGARVDVPTGAIGPSGTELSIGIARDSTDAPAVPPGFRPLGDMFAVTPHVRADGSVVTSGYDGAGELGLDSVIGGSTLGPVGVRAETCASVPCADTLTSVTALASGSSAATLALKNEQILGWGSRGSGLLGPVASGSQSFPRPVASPGVSGFTALSASYAHALVIGPGNVVCAWGSNLRFALGDSDNRSAPTMVTVP